METSFEVGDVVRTRNGQQGEIIEVIPPGDLRWIFSWDESRGPIHRMDYQREENHKGGGYASSLTLIKKKVPSLKIEPVAKKHSPLQLELF